MSRIIREGWHDTGIDYGVFAGGIKKVHAHERTPFQLLTVVETTRGQTVFLLDQMMMNMTGITQYGEYMTHPALCTHPNPENVLIIGGGDGEIIVQCLKNPKVKKIILVDIDKKVIENCKKFFPEYWSWQDTPDASRVDVKVGDGFDHIIQSENQYDVIITDSTEPVGPAANLFSKGFYHGLHKALRSDGLFVAQTNTPYVPEYLKLLGNIQKETQSVFPICRTYGFHMPIYPTGYWTATIGSKVHDPLEVDSSKIPELGTMHYHGGNHLSLFQSLPNFAKQYLDALKTKSQI